ncbi:MAG: polyprenyl synthetase family protein [Proteobacteria bacterium]|nr:polyprenyl synthetase family protein [Pseudomonadota bacterium]
MADLESCDAQPLRHEKPEVRPVIPQGMLDVRDVVNARLEAFFAAKRRMKLAVSTPACELYDALGELTLRGGKRLRPMVAWSGAKSIDPGARPEDTAVLGASLELLQAYLLVHDDWMDGDALRRGRTTLHVRFGKRYQSRHMGACLAVLAGDLANAMALELLLGCSFPTATRARAYATFAQASQEVVVGQQLDLLGHRDVACVARLKTGSYTLRAPLRLGALLFDAGDDQLEALDRFARPAGLAFQMRDDLLDVFGEAGRVGKPFASDLRQGRRTALVEQAEMQLAAGDRRAFAQVHGNTQASDAQIRTVVDLLERRGVKAHAEARLQALVADARAALDAAPLDPSPLSELLDVLTSRQS